MSQFYTVTDGPLVSILTPTFNHETYIATCIESVLEQSYTNWELIIIDDGSTDATSNIISKYTLLSTKIRYLRQPNKGLQRLHETYNTALHLAKGTYIAILEGDDYWHPKKLEVQIAKMQAAKADFCYCKTLVVNNSGKLLNTIPRYYQVHMHHLYQNEPLGSCLGTLLNDFPIPCSWVFSKKALLALGGFQQHPSLITVDLSTILSISKEYNFVYIDQSLAYYRRQMAQATRTQAVQIAVGTHKVVLDYFTSLTPPLQHNTGFNTSTLAEALDVKIQIAHVIAGKSALRKKAFKEARRYFAVPLFNIKNIMFYWRFLALLGYLAAYIRLDIFKRY